MAWLRSSDHANMNLPVVVTLPLSIDAERLTAAMRSIIGVRRALRMNFNREPSGEVVMHPVMFPQVVHRHTAEAEVEREIHEFVRPFHPFSMESLCRFEILTTPRHHYLLIDCHHSIADGYTLSAQLLQEDLPRAYAGEPLREESDGQTLAADHYQRALLSPAYREGSEYYRKTLRGKQFTRACSMPHDPWGKWHKASEYMHRDEVEKWCESHNVTPHQLFMAAWSLTLSRWSGEDEVHFFTLHHGRRREWRHSYGMFVDSLPISVDCSAEKTVCTLLREMRTALRSAIRYSAYPFTHLCSDLNMEPATTFAYQSSNVSEKIEIGGERVQCTQYHSSDSNSDVSCVVYVHSTEIEIRFEVSDKFLDATQLRSLAKSVRHVAGQLMLHTDAPLSHITLTDQTEQHSLLALGRGERQTYDRHLTWVSMWLKQSIKSADATAVIDNHGSITYHTLNRHSAEVAHRLLSTGYSNGNVVLATERNRHLLTGMAAIMRSGMTMVPVDAESPEQHITGIIGDCRAHCVLTTHATVSTYGWHPEEWQAANVIYIDEPADDSADLTLDLSTPDGTAYILYTSGSTGKPKGVMIAHSALTAFVHFIVRQWQLDADSRISCQASVAFDASIEDLLPVLTAGGSVVIADEQTRRDLPLLTEMLRRHRVNGGCYTPQVGLMVSEQEVTLNYLCLGGDVLTRMPTVPYRVMNTYGPTECTVDATWHEWDGKNGDAPPHPVPIGRPLPAVDVYVVDQSGHLLPEGAIGELWIGGDQVALGYWADEVLTAQRFTPCPWAEGRVYHTGDRVRWNANSLLEYIGRKDSQLKINGQRVEPDEVKAVLKEIDGIDEVHVAATSVGSASHLSAWYTTHDDRLTPDVLRERLLQLLPRYMVPTRWKQMADMPHLLSGKTNVHHLPQPDNTGMRQVCPPQTHTEQLLCDAWCEVLHTDDVGIDDNFFLLGGTSLTAMALTGACARRGLTLNYSTVFHHPTIRAMAAQVGMQKSWLHVTVKDWRREMISTMLNREPEHSTVLPTAPHRVLITGASGYLGCHLLHILLTQSHAHIVCIVHATDHEAAAEKLLSAMDHYFYGKMPPLYHYFNRLTIEYGDVSNMEDMTRMRALRIDTVIHCAAIVKHFAPGKDIYRANVRGTYHVIDLCRHASASLLHISTVSVGGDMSITARQWYEGQTFHNDYEKSKFMAEGMVLEALHNGLQGQVIRVGNLTASATSDSWRTSRDKNAFMKLVDIISHTGVIPQRWADKEVDISPVDLVAADIISQAQGARSQPIIILSHYRRQTWMQYMSHTCHASPRKVSDEEWEKMLSHSKDKEWMALIREYNL